MEGLLISTSKFSFSIMLTLITYAREIWGVLHFLNPLDAGLISKQT